MVAPSTRTPHRITRRTSDLLDKCHLSSLRPNGRGLPALTVAVGHPPESASRPATTVREAVRARPANGAAH